VGDRGHRGARRVRVASLAVSVTMPAAALLHKKCKCAIASIAARFVNARRPPSRPSRLPRRERDQAVAPRRSRPMVRRCWGPGREPRCREQLGWAVAAVRVVQARRAPSRNESARRTRIVGERAGRGPGPAPPRPGTCTGDGPIRPGAAFVMERARHAAAPEVPAAGPAVALREGGRGREREIGTPATVAQRRGVRACVRVCARSIYKNSGSK
jgi:hypothetical protein